jgi:RHS repeat-associated protein
VVTESVEGAAPITLSYDQDGLITGLGGLSISRDSNTGFASGETIGVVTDARSYNEFGERTEYAVTSNAASVFSVSETYDVLGRVTSRQEMTPTGTQSFGYVYTEAGPLGSVTVGGVQTASFTYDDNGNRLSKTGSAGTTVATYDAQDRLTSSGASTYSYGPNGELSSKHDATTGASTAYRYDSLGVLREVDLPDGRVVTYQVDGRNRRIAKLVDGVLVRKWIYWDALQPAAELGPDDAVISQFARGEYMVKAGANYRLVRDDVGSVRLVIDVASGAVVQAMQYDEWGRVLSDSNPESQPFGFAGGMYDRDTGLVHFGRRDYDAETGRWLSKDTLAFAASRPNLYLYGGDDPINMVDPSGHDFEHFAVALGLILGGGFETEENGAVFWNGELGRARAEEYATRCGLKTLERTTGGEILQWLDLAWRGSELSPGELQVLWGGASAGFAMGASGEANAFVGGNISGQFYNVELPILLINPDVTAINIYFSPWGKDPCDCPPNGVQ